MPDIKRINAISLEEDEDKFSDKPAQHPVTQPVQPAVSKPVQPPVSNPAQAVVKKKRNRKSKEEVLTALNDKRQKLLAELSKVDNQIEKKRMTPEEKKEKRRCIDTRCKIIAGAIILKIIKRGEIFDLNKFKQNIFATLDNSDDQEYFDKIFHE